jgi:hypothetical protein
MPLYEFECINCRKGIEESLKQIEKKVNDKIVTDLVKKFDNIYRIEVIDLDNENLVADYGKKNEDSSILDFYLDEGTKAVLFNSEDYRFTDLIYDKSDEKKIKCPFCKSKKLEKVFSSFAFTSDLSTDMPKPDLSNMPPSVRNRTMITDYIEEKDRPKKNR